MTTDKSAPRVIVETPVDSEFCSARQNAQTQLAKHKFVLDSQHGGELPLALPVDVLGMAFEDFDHNRGSAQVQTIWELHPAIVTIPRRSFTFVVLALNLEGSRNATYLSQLARAASRRS